MTIDNSRRAALVGFATLAAGTAALATAWIGDGTADAVLRAQRGDLFGKGVEFIGLFAQLRVQPVAAPLGCRDPGGH